HLRSLLSSPHPPPTTAIYTLSLHDALPICHLTDSRSSVFIHLDTDLVDELTNPLAGPPPERLSGNPVDHIKHLPVRLDCVIASVRMPLSQVLGLQLDDILMVRPLDRYEVRINQQKLFRGTVFE